jgi:hypothetical protein
MFLSHAFRNMLTTRPVPADAKRRDVKLLSKCRSNVRSFCDLEIPDGTEKLRISDNAITDFVGLRDIDSLIDVIIDNNPIISFRGFPTLGNLKHLSLRQTPIAKLPNFRALAVLCTGDQLESLNGQEVTTVDRTSAKAYASGKPAISLRGFTNLSHPPEMINSGSAARDLIVRGWLPREPIALSRARKIRSKTTRLSEMVSGWNAARDIRADILAMVERQEQDPISVQIARTLREIGSEESDIQASLRKHFAPILTAPPRKAPPPLSEVDARLEGQEKVLQTLATQLHALRSGNRTFNDYQAMIGEAGNSLIENAEIVSRYLGNEGRQSKAGELDYEGLRKAVIAFLREDPDTTDADLINALIHRAEEEEDMADLAEEEEAVFEADLLEDE